MQKILTGGLVVALVAIAWLGSLVVSARERLGSTEAAVEALKAEQGATRATVDAEIARMREADAAAEDERAKALSALRADVGQARNQAKGAEGRVDAAYAETLRNLENLSARLNTNETTIRTQRAEIANELKGVQQATKSAQAGVTAVSSEVSSVKADVSATSQRVDQALAELRKTSGDLGQLSGLIATTRSRSRC
jgi:chromosome segregation ATPase